MAQAFGQLVGSAVAQYLSSRSSSDSASRSYNDSVRLMNVQHQLDRKARQTSYQDTRYSLEQAGYNPLLAVGQQANGGSYGATLNQTDPKTENLQNDLATMNTLSGVHLNSAQANLHNRNAFATVLNALNNTNQTNATVSNLNSQTLGNNIQNNINAMYGMQTANATLQNIKASTNNTNVNSQLQKAQTQVAKATVGLVNSQTGLTNAQTQGQNFANVSSGRTAQWIQKHPTLSGLGVGAQQLGAPITSAITGVAGLGIGAGINKFLNPHRPVGFNVR